MDALLAKRFSPYVSAMIVISRITRHSCLALLVVSIWGSFAQAQGTALVSTGDLAYQDLDRLSELGVLDSVIVGQRPYSRREIGRITRIASTLLGHLTGDAVDDAALVSAEAIVLRLSQRFGNTEGLRADTDPVVALFDGGSLTYVSSTVDRRALVGLGREIQATIGAFDGGRIGQPEIRGRTGALELTQRIEPLTWLSFSSSERVERRSPNDTSIVRAGREVLLANVRARYWNVAVTAGRSQIAWSQHAGDGLLFASDAPALDGIFVAGDRPFLLPGPLRRLGGLQATALFVDLGPSLVRSHSRLLAYKVSAAPTSTLEIGGSFLNHFGGVGSRPTSLGNRLIDFLPFLDIFRKHNYLDTTQALEAESDKVLGLDGRLRLGRVGGIVLGGELLIDDFDARRLRTLLTWDGSQTLSLTAPRLLRQDVSLALSVKHTGVRTYSHSQLTNGLSTRGRLFGDELGPDAKSFGASLAWNSSAATRLSIEARTAVHSKANYGGISDSTQFVIYRLGDASNELRDRLMGSLVVQSQEGLGFVVRLGGVRMRNYQFSGKTHRDYLAEVSLRVAR